MQSSPVFESMKRRLSPFYDLRHVTNFRELCAHFKLQNPPAFESVDPPTCWQMATYLTANASLPWFRCTGYAEIDYKACEYIIDAMVKTMRHLHKPDNPHAIEAYQIAWK